jgi:hypothetical protein
MIRSLLDPNREWPDLKMRVAGSGQYLNANSRGVGFEAGGAVYFYLELHIGFFTATP